VTRYYGVSYGSLEETQAQMDGTITCWKARRASGGASASPMDPSRLIGACGFNEWHRVHNRAEIGYWLLPDYWGQGVMTECLPPSSGTPLRPCTCTESWPSWNRPNGQSARLVQKLGFRYEGTLRECELKNGTYIDHAYYALLNPTASPAAARP
jgi:ribosomal-protein-alanine N-acetyltransferase